MISLKSSIGFERAREHARLVVLLYRFSGPTLAKAQSKPNVSSAQNRALQGEEGDSEDRDY